MRAGHLLIKIKDAKISKEELDTANLDEDEIFCAAKIEDVGKLYTETRPMKEPFSWQEELAFNFPAGQESPCTLELMLYKQRTTSEEHHLVGMGSISLEGLEEGANKRDVELPLVDNNFKNNGVITATCQFFPSRCPGKSRDDLGRETLDPILVGKGVKEGAKELNQRSPKKAPRKSSNNKATKAAESDEELTTSNAVARGIPPEELLPVG